MDELPLPPDLERWPRDPFGLLGVKMGSDLKTVKRAYQRLIRVYRPEHYPVEFRRIREAYESAQSMTGWFSTVDSDIAEEVALRGPAEALQTDDDLPAIPLTPDPLKPDDEGTRPEQALPNAEPAAHIVPRSTIGSPPAEQLPVDYPTSMSTPPAAEPPASNSPVIDPPIAAPEHRPEVDEYGDRPYELCLAAAWRPALGGDAASAYRALSALCRERPGRSEAYLALYWLLRLTPKLEVERRPCDWLTECLSASDDAGPALELYRRELVRRPAEAISPRCTALVRSPNVRPGVVALVEFRWRAALAAQRDAASIVREDLDALRKTRLSYDSNAWLRVLWAVVETCCWSRTPQAKQLTSDAMRELERFANAPDANHDAISQLDYMTEASASVNTLGNVESIERFRRLIVRSWSMSGSDLYVLLTRFVEPFLPQPDYLLDFLTELAGRGALVLGRYGQVLQMVQHELGRNEETFWTPTTAENAILDFLESNQVRIRYDEDLRKKLLDFCLYERMPPELMAESINSGYEFKESVRWLPERLMQDWPLRFAYATLNLMTA